jgi:predicted RNA-binding Zn-ribbon protein involved in translation (DUF1610 family)
MSENPYRIRCKECGNWHTLRTDEYKFLCGFRIVKITGVPYYRCDSCGNILLTPEMCKVLDNEYAKTKDGK